MAAQLSTAEINDYREIFPKDDPAQEVLAILDKNNGSFDDSLTEIYSEKFGSLPDMAPGKSLLQITLKQLREEVCGNEGFRAQVSEYNKNPRSVPLLTGLIVSLVGLAAANGFPLDPAIATVVVLYILKIGLNVFCEYTEPSGKDSSSRRIPDD